MRICLMIEGQESVTWDEWVALAGACEESPIEALFRSDHYLSVVGQTDRGSLDAHPMRAARTSFQGIGTWYNLRRCVVSSDTRCGGNAQ